MIKQEVVVKMEDLADYTSAGIDHCGVSVDYGDAGASYANATACVLRFLCLRTLAPSWICSVVFR